MDENTLQKLKKLYAAENCLLHQNEDGTFTIMKAVSDRLAQRIVSESILLEECRKRGWL